MSWHVNEVIARRYVARRLDPTDAASVEAHLVGCGVCRGLVGDAVDGAHGHLLDLVWSRVTDVVDRPVLGRIERALCRLGCSEATARVVAATTRSRRAYLLAVAVSIGLALVAGRSGDPEFFAVFLLAAPLGPLAATASSFGQWNDPMADVWNTAPVSSLRLLLVRTAAAVVPAVALTAVSVLWLADRGWMAVAWLLPSLALTLGAVALSSWCRIETAVVALGAAWIVIPVALRAEVSVLIDVLTGPVQVISLITVVVAAAITTVRRSSFDYREV